MQPELIDPHNHVPMPRPGDVWDDADTAVIAAAGPTRRLPRRQKSTHASEAAARHGDGLRLDSKAQRPPPATKQAPVEPMLEVQEIGGEAVQRLDPTIAAPQWAQRQLVHRERAPRRVRDVAHGWGRNPKVSMRWLLGTGLGVAFIVVVSMMLLPLINESNAARTNSLELRVVTEDDDFDGIATLRDLFTRQPEAEQLFQTLATASTAAEMLPLLRHPAAIAPLVRANPRLTTVPAGWVVPNDSAWDVIANDGQPFGLLTCTMPDFSAFTSYWKIEGTQLLLDWKATTGYGTATFEQLVIGRGNPAEIRGKIRPTTFFTSAFAEADYQSYLLTSPDGGSSLWCYARRGDPTDVALGVFCSGGEIFDPKPEERNVTLRLERGPAGSLPNQWLITEMLHKEWIQP